MHSCFNFSQGLVSTPFPDFEPVAKTIFQWMWVLKNWGLLGCFVWKDVPQSRLIQSPNWHPSRQTFNPKRLGCFRIRGGWASYNPSVKCSVRRGCLVWLNLVACLADDYLSIGMKTGLILQITLYPGYWDLNLNSHYWQSVFVFRPWKPQFWGSDLLPYFAYFAHYFTRQLGGGADFLGLSALSARVQTILQLPRIIF